MGDSAEIMISSPSNPAGGGGGGNNSSSLASLSPSSSTAALAIVPSTRSTSSSVNSNGSNVPALASSSNNAGPIGSSKESSNTSSLGKHAASVVLNKMKNMAGKSSLTEKYKTPLTDDDDEVYSHDEVKGNDADSSPLEDQEDPTVRTAADHSNKYSKLHPPHHEQPSSQQEHQDYKKSSKKNSSNDRKKLTKLPSNSTEEFSPTEDSRDNLNILDYYNDINYRFQSDDGSNPGFSLNDRTVAQGAIFETPPVTHGLSGNLLFESNRNQAEASGSEKNVDLVVNGAREDVLDIYGARRLSNWSSTSHFDVKFKRIKESIRKERRKTSNSLRFFSGCINVLMKHTPNLINIPLLGIWFGFGIAQISMAAIFWLAYCEDEFIKKWLIVSGTLTLMIAIFIGCTRVTSVEGDFEFEANDEMISDQDILISDVCGILSNIFSVVNCIWLFVGAHSVYNLDIGPNYDECFRPLYLFTFWCITAGLVVISLLALFIIIYLLVAYFIIAPNIKESRLVQQGIL